MSATPEVLEHVYLSELCIYCGTGESDGERLDPACIARKVVTVHTIEQRAQTSDTAATATANEPAYLVRHVYDGERCRLAGATERLVSRYGPLERLGAEFARLREEVEAAAASAGVPS